MNVEEKINYAKWKVAELAMIIPKEYEDVKIVIRFGVDCVKLDTEMTRTDADGSTHNFVSSIPIYTEEDFERNFSVIKEWIETKGATPKNWYATKKN